MFVLFMRATVKHEVYVYMWTSTHLSNEILGKRNSNIYHVCRPWYVWIGSTYSDYIGTQEGHTFLRFELKIPSSWDLKDGRIVYPFSKIKTRTNVLVNVSFFFFFLLGLPFQKWIKNRFAFKLTAPIVPNVFLATNIFGTDPFSNIDK